MKKQVDQEIWRPPFVHRALRVLLAVGLTGCVAVAGAQDTKSNRPPHDAVAEAQEPRTVAIERPEQKKTDHDRSGIFEAQKAKPSSPAFLNQLRDGKISGFDFYRDPLGAEKPMQEPEEIMKKDIAGEAKSDGDATQVAGVSLSSQAEAGFRSQDVAGKAAAGGADRAVA